MKRIALALGLLASSPQLASADDPAPPYACKETPATTKIQASFAPDTSLRDLVTWLAGVTCKSVVVDAEVYARGPKVSIVAPKPMTPKQALQLFINAVQATGMTVISKQDTIIIKLGPKMPKTCPTDAAMAADATRVTEYEKAITDGVKTVDATHFEVKASVVDTILGNPMATAKGGRIVPAVKNGKPVGFKLYAIKPGSIYARIGLQNGDTIEKLNGMEMTSADKALELYTQMRNAKSLTIDLLRAGKPISLVITIVAD